MVQSENEAKHGRKHVNFQVKWDISNEKCEKFSTSAKKRTYSRSKCMSDKSKKY